MPDAAGANLSDDIGERRKADDLKKKDERAAQQRAAHLKRFARRFLDVHAHSGDQAWYSFAYIAEGCVTKYPERFINRIAAYDCLWRDLFLGCFKSGTGRSRVLLVYQDGAHRVARDYFEEVVKIAGVDLVEGYLVHCWIPRDCFLHWIKQRELQRLLEWFDITPIAGEAGGAFSSPAPGAIAPSSTATPVPPPTQGAAGAVHAMTAGELADKKVCAEKRKDRVGKWPLIIDWLRTRFNGEAVPGPSHAPRKALIAEAIIALPLLGGKLDESTMKRAIDEYNAAVGHDPK